MFSKHRDSLLTIGGFGLLLAVFLFAFYRPEFKFQQALRADIAQAEQAIRGIPARLAELESLRTEVDRRRTHLQDLKNRLPADPEVQGVVQSVTELARRSSLTVTRFEPRGAEPQHTYQRLPFQIAFVGEYAGTVAFLRGLEQQERLITIQEFTLRPASPARGNSAVDRSSGSLEVDVKFAVYVRDRESADSAEKSEKSDS